MAPEEHRSLQSQVEDGKLTNTHTNLKGSQFDGWVMPGRAAPRCRGVELLKEASCVPTHWEPFSSRQEQGERPPQASFCSSNDAFDAGRCAKIDGLRFGSCRVTSAFGTWHTERLGPFVTTGGWDWTTLQWLNALHTSELLRTAGGELCVNAFADGPVDDTGLQRAPIHEHHTHVNDLQHIKYKQGGCCYHNPSPGVFQHHGDTADACMSRDLSPNIVLVRHPFVVQSQLNDVRPFNSTPITWYYQVSARLGGPACVPPIAGRAVSFHTAHNIYRTVPQHRLLQLRTYPVRTDMESILWYTWRVPFDGELLVMYLHNHAAVFDAGMLFNCSPSELTLNRTALRPDPPYLPKEITPSTGFNSSRELQEWLVRSFPEQLLCTSSLGGSTEPWHDRPSTVRCRPFELRKGQIMTTVSFHRRLDEPVRIVENHMHFNYLYLAPEAVSRSTMSPGEQDNIVGLVGDYTGSGHPI